MAGIVSLESLYNSSVMKLTRNKNNWTSYLRTAARLYKYSFRDTVLIYAQRPDATACASYELWQRLGRNVRRYAHGISVYDKSQGSVRHLFDVSDTGGDANTKPVLWQMTDANRQAILKWISWEELVDKEKNDTRYFNKALSKLVALRTEELYDGYYKDLIADETSIIESLPEEEIRQCFLDTVSESVLYSVYSRCGIQDELKTTFEYLPYFNTVGVMDTLGMATNEITNDILISIEREIRQVQKERNLKYERIGRNQNHLQACGGRDAAQPGDVGSRAENNVNQIRFDEAGLSGNRASGQVQFAFNAGETETTLPGDREPGAGVEGHSDGATQEAIPAAREDRLHGERAVQLHDQRHGRGSGDQGDRVRQVGPPDEVIKEEKQEAGEMNNPAFSILNEKTGTNPGNFQITDDTLGVGGAKTKYKMNTDAIRLLQTIESENRWATRGEQEMLSRYVGWGGLPQVFDDKNGQWAGEYAELKSLLSDAEYMAARASTLNAHYTSPVVIRAMYTALENMGFSGGNILEPGCGPGAFFGSLPDSMAKSKLYGVELDGITGRIAKQLYPDARIQVQGFEETEFEDNFFDVAIGNVPFGSYKLADKRYDKYNLLIHDYFFVKAMDKVRPGGIVAFITSKGTMDKANPEVRKYLAQRAELMGAIRLPNNAFKSNAGTEVTTDILFLKKRERPVVELPEWVYTEQNSEGIPINHYFLEHPEMLLGTMSFENTMYGNQKDTTLIPFEGADLAEQLQKALQGIQGSISDYETELEAEEAAQDFLPADPNVRNYSFTLINGNIYFRENSRMTCTTAEGAVKQRILGMINIRDCVRELIDSQIHDRPDEVIDSLQIKMNGLYDDYAVRYGILNSRGNKLAFDKDSSYPLLCSLEILDEEKKTAQKAEIFSKRTIRPYRAITHVDTASEALAVSLAEKAGVDVSFMAGLCDKSQDDILSDLQGLLYKNPLSDLKDKYSGWETADEYLSGNVREKLIIARNVAEGAPEFDINVEALKAVQPKDLEAVEIDVRLGSTWVPPEDIRDFLLELVEPPEWAEKYIHVRYSRHSGNWLIEGKGQIHGNIKATETFGTNRMNAYDIIEDSLNLRTVQVNDTIRENGKDRSVPNRGESIAAQQKQSVIQDRFKNWIWENPERRERLVRAYNDQFNNIRTRSYNGSHIAFAGMNPELGLREHQRNAVARILYGGNTLLAHVVGSGKTFTMTAAVQEAKRIGLCQKAMIAVPNHLTEQWAAEYLRLYPAANILVATQKDFETHRRKTFCGRIATGEYDAVILGHSQLLKIPMSKEWQQDFIREQIDDIMDGISEAKQERAENWTIKQMERTRKSLETKLQKLNDTSKKDNVIDFEQLGIDWLLVDEADEFKNLLIQTKMRNVAGIGQTESQKASDLYMKCRYIDRITGERGNTFATGTPISNTLSEMYTMQRYLQHGELKKRGLEHFDSWASVFAETRTELELAITGKGYRTKNRLASYHNLPELTTMFAEFADVQTAEMLDLPVPKIKGGKVKTIALKPSNIQKKMVETLEVRSEKISKGLVSPEVDNNLSLTNDGRKLALDVRLIDPLLPDEPGSKVNECANNVYRIWNDTMTIKGTQLAFCDLSTPHGEEDFSVYTDLKAKLIAMGIPEKEIEFIHSAKTDIQKEILFGKVRSGNIRVLIGSTAKMGAGTNVQRLLCALHHLDVPWRPRDLMQREGRILRQGNLNDEVEIIRYVTEGTFDSYNYQIVEHKQRFISQIMTNKPPARRMDEVDNATLSYAEVKAIASGNPKIKEKMELDTSIAKLQVLRNQHKSQQYRLQNVIRFEIPANIKYEEVNLSKLIIDRQSYTANTSKEFCIWVGGMKFIEKTPAGDALKSMAKQVKEPDKVFVIGEYSGFPVGIRYDTYDKKHFVVVRGKVDYTIEMSDSSIGLIQRLDNTLHGIDDRIQRTEQKIQKYTKELGDAVSEKEKPFPFEAELSEKLEKVTALNIELSMDKPAEPILLDEEQIEIAESCGPVFDEGNQKEMSSMAQAYAALKKETAVYETRQNNERER